MCQFFAVSRSGYYSFVKRMKHPEKNASLAQTIRQQQVKCFHTYGYRRMWQWLERNVGIHHNPKTILHVMKKYGLLAEIRRRRKWQQMGQQLHKYQNLLNRNFHAEAPNHKWVTDISYIQTKQGVLYLSMVRDLYDNSIVAIRPQHSRRCTWCWIPSARQCLRRKRGSLQNSTSTATKGSSTPPNYTGHG